MKESSHNEFEHGDAYSRNSQSYGKIMDFSASIAFKKDTKKLELDIEDLKHYPVASDEMKKLIGNVSGFNPDNITPGYGLTSLIYAIYKIYSCGRVLFAEPIFSEHRRSASIEKMSISRIPIKIILSEPKMIRNYSPDIVSINSPINPTGEYVRYENIERILEILSESGGYLFLDEAFIDFVPFSIRGNTQKLIEKYSNLIIGRSFSKISGLAGIRLGYTISSVDIARKIENNMEPWTIPQYYSRILPELLTSATDPDALSRERNYVIERLIRSGCAILGRPDANYISFRLPENINGNTFREKLLRKGFLIRSISNFYGFEESDFRIAILDRESDQKLMEAIDREIKNGR